MTSLKIILGQTADKTTVELDPYTLLKHVVVLGASGSGKTCLSKVVVEDAVRLGIPVIAIDSQGDIASLGLHGDQDLASEMASEYWDKVDLKIWTPGSSLGTPISLQPDLNLGVYERYEDRVRALHSMGNELAALIDSTDEAVVAGFSKIIDYADRYALAIDSVDDICDFLEDPPMELADELEPIFDKRSRAKALKSMIVKKNGPRQLLLEMGEPISIDSLLGYNDSSFENGKTRVSIVSLAAMLSPEDRQIFVAALARAMYAWMIQDPKPYPVAMFYLDEAARYLPPVSKPVSKMPLMLLLREARKYGVSMLIATQSPGDIDYAGMGQVGTKLLGRMSTNQEAQKVRPLLETDQVDISLVDSLPDLQQGEFIAISPDSFAEPILFKSRQLITNHKTLTLEAAVRM